MTIFPPGFPLLRGKLPFGEVKRHALYMLRIYSTLNV